MDKPLCRLCGQRHYGNCAGVTPTRGDVRTETDPSILTRNVPDKPPPKRPSPFDVPGAKDARFRFRLEPLPPDPNLTAQNNLHHQLAALKRENAELKAAVTNPVTSHATVTECPRCVTLERDATLMRNKIAALETELRVEQAKTRTKPPPLTPAERQRRRRERQASKIRPSPKNP